MLGTGKFSSENVLEKWPKSSLNTKKSEAIFSPNFFVYFFVDFTRKTVLATFVLVFANIFAMKVLNA